MLSSITPLGERARGRSWRRTVAAFFFGALGAGAAIGAALGGLGALSAPLPVRARWAAGAAVALALAGLGERGRLPSWQRQVDESWLDRYRGWVVGLGYGAQLGVGVVTIVPTALTPIALVLAWLAGAPGAGAGIGAAYALARALPLLAARRIGAPVELHRLHRRLSRLARPAQLAARAGSLGGAAALAVTAGLLR